MVHKLVVALESASRPVTVDRDKLRNIILEYMPGADGEPDSRTITDAIIESGILGRSEAQVKAKQEPELEEDGYPYNLNGESRIEAVCKHCAEVIEKYNGRWWHDGTGPCYTFSGNEIGHPAGEPDYTREWAAPTAIQGDHA
jgi:hypothetical protein